jgi:glycine/serine hydroxymethyltransferase
MGVQELTRTGMTAADVPEVADCIVDALKEEDPEQVRRRVRDLANRFRQVRFTSDNEQGGA